jgi:hypothetical protein
MTGEIREPASDANNVVRKCLILVAPNLAAQNLHASTLLVSERTLRAFSSRVVSTQAFVKLR